MKDSELLKDCLAEMESLREVAWAAMAGVNGDASMDVYDMADVLAPADAIIGRLKKELGQE